MTTITYADLADWVADNPVPGEWEVCVVNDDGRVKLGDNVTDWRTLPFVGEPAINEIVGATFDQVDGGPA